MNIKDTRDMVKVPTIREENKQKQYLTKQYCQKFSPKWPKHQEILQTPRKIIINKTTPKRIMIKLLNNKDQAAEKQTKRRP